MKKLLVIFTILIVISNLFGQGELINSIENLDKNKYCENSINDTLKAPYYIYIPENYDAKKRTPLIIYLHGGISRPNFPEEFDKYVEENHLLKFAKQENWLMLFPEANMQTLWWELSGMENLFDQLHSMKNSYNLDDDRIFLTGFSDGASGTFQFALSKPDNFASFYPQNGNMSVGNAAAKNSIFLPNFRNRFLKVINTDNDGLYPAEQMRKLCKISLEAGANLLYSEYWGIGHRPDYWEQEYPILIDLMKTHPRNIFNSHLYWECNDIEYGKCDWIEITEIDTLEIKKNWQVQYQVKLTEKRISFGYYPDNNFEGQGAKVLKVIPNSTAEKIGLKSDDLILEFDGNLIMQSDDIGKYKKLKKRGDAFSLLVLRNSKEILLNGKFPEVTHYDAFRYYLSSGAVDATYYGNHFEIQTSRVQEIAIYINPKMVNLNIPVIINVNGNEKFNKIIEIDKAFLLENFKENIDRKALWTNKIVLKIK